jgi:hypothetical protein
MMMETQPSGVRLIVATAARTVALVCHPTRLAYRDADRPRGSIDLVVDGRLAASDPLAGGDLIEVDLRTGANTFQPGQPHTASTARQGTTCRSRMTASLLWARPLGNRPGGPSFKAAPIQRCGGIARRTI